MKELSKTSIYDWKDIVDHVGAGGTLDFEDFYTVNINKVVVNKPTGQAYLLDIDGNEMWIAKSQSDLDEERKTVDIKGWLINKKLQE